MSPAGIRPCPLTKAITPFCESAAKLPPAQYGGPSDVLRYIAFLLEGIFMRLFK